MPSYMADKQPPLPPLSLNAEANNEGLSGGLKSTTGPSATSTSSSGTVFIPKTFFFQEIGSLAFSIASVESSPFFVAFRKNVKIEPV